VSEITEIGKKSDWWAGSIRMLGGGRAASVGQESQSAGWVNTSCAVVVAPTELSEIRSKFLHLCPTSNASSEPQSTSFIDNFTIDQ